MLDFNIIRSGLWGELSPPAKAAYVVLLAFFNEEGYARLPVEVITELAGYSDKNSISAAIRELHRKKLIVSLPRKRGQHGLIKKSDSWRSSVRAKETQNQPLSSQVAGLFDCATSRSEVLKDNINITSRARAREGGPPDKSTVREIQTYFVERWAELHGYEGVLAPPSFNWGQAGKMIKWWLEHGFSEELIKHSIDAYLEHDERWIGERGWTWGVFQKAANEYFKKGKQRMDMGKNYEQTARRQEKQARERAQRDRRAEETAKRYIDQYRSMNDDERAIVCDIMAEFADRFARIERTLLKGKPYPPEQKIIYAMTKYHERRDNAETD